MSSRRLCSCRSSSATLAPNNRLQGGIVLATRADAIIDLFTHLGKSFLARLAAHVLARTGPGGDRRALAPQRAVLGWRIARLPGNRQAHRRPVLGDGRDAVR